LHFESNRGMLSLEMNTEQAARPSGQRNGVQFPASRSL